MCPKVIGKEVFNLIQAEFPEQKNVLEQSYEYVDSLNIYRRKRGLEYETKVSISKVLIPMKLNKYLNSKGKNQYVL